MELKKTPLQAKTWRRMFFYYYYYFCSDIAEKQGTVNYFFFLATDMAFGISWQMSAWQYYLEAEQSIRHASEVRRGEHFVKARKHIVFLWRHTADYSVCGGTE